MPVRAAVAVGVAEAKSALSRVRGMLRTRAHPRVLGLTGGSTPGARGPALLSYLAAPATFPAGDARFAGHSNAWESAEIARAMAELGYAVDVVDWDDDEFDGASRDYRLVLDIHGRLARFAGAAGRRVLHVTGSHPRFSNDAERARLDAVRARRGAVLRPRRSFTPEAVAAFESSLDAADVVTLIGDERTRATFPPRAAARMRLVPVTASFLPRRRNVGELPDPRTFIWFGGSGAVHKGLDVTLEAFARRPELTLHVVGPYARETDFVRAYARELFSTANIRSHGYLVPSDPRFQRLALRSAAFILPSCSEAISTAAVTCLQFGLYPIVSSRCGLTLPPGVGHELDQCTPEEIEAAAGEVASWSPGRAAEAIALAQRDALERYSREAFGAAMRAELALAVS